MVTTTRFRSILFADHESWPASSEQPSFFQDLNLDQVIKAITAGREQYDLKPFFYLPLHQVDLIEYRQQIFRDLDGTSLLRSIKSFANRMEEMRRHLSLAKKVSYAYQSQKWFLDAVGIYCDLVTSIANDLSQASPQSKGLSVFREFLISYTESDHFKNLVEQTQALQTDLAAIQYCIRIKGGSFRVRRLESESNYSAAVEETFAKFRQGAVKDYRVQFSEYVQMNHIEAKVLEFVARLYPELFSKLASYCADNVEFLDLAISTFDREIQFYIAYLDHIEKFRKQGWRFCYPTLTSQPTDIHVDRLFDLALANKLAQQEMSIILNDFRLSGNERVIVVSGPNQGGKTTFARAFGQAHYLASLGLLVPGTSARLLLFDRIFTHFEREEEVKNLRGKLQDDLLRIREILNSATSSSLLIMNEIFTSTTVRDALFLSEEIMRRILELGLLCVWVTFVDELASFGERVVSMVAAVDSDDPTVRTFKVIRARADGLSYAMSIAEKYRLTYRQLKERIRS